MNSLDSLIDGVELTEGEETTATTTITEQTTEYSTEDTPVEDAEITGIEVTTKEENNKTDSKDEIENWVPLTNGQKRFSGSECKLDEKIINEIQSYKTDVKKIIDYIMSGAYKGRTYETLAELVDTFGPRLVSTTQNFCTI